MQFKKHSIQVPAPTFIASAVIIIITVSSVLFPLTSLAGPLNNIIDISSPQCNDYSSIGRRSFGIVGVNNNKGDFDANPCLGEEIHQFSSYALYIDLNYPSSHCPNPDTREGAVACGTNLGIWEVKTASSQHAYSNFWWFDVEGGPGTGISWSTNSLDQSFLNALANSVEQQENIVLASGRRDGRIVTGTQVGYYSTKDDWPAITGNNNGWDHNAPAWLSVGDQPSSSGLKSDCRYNLTGGPEYYVQWYVGSSVDVDIPC
jgi:hypothetical protein